ncbi:uncharacterized protein LOC134216791 [Armigeres subalbatus]|uniref:uncharacterized protein LOC134216791 n=1 Tax=Armigeres subalbatus TaxID=124917 RepID=UPI002ED2FC9D
MARKRVNAARNRVKQQSNEKNSEFILNELTGSVPFAECTNDNVAPLNSRKKRSIIRGCAKGAKPLATQTRGKRAVPCQIDLTKKGKFEPNDPQPGTSRPRISVVENICPSRGAAVGPQYDPGRSRRIEAEHIFPSCGAATNPQPGPSRPRISVENTCSSRGAAVGQQSDPSRSRIIVAEHISASCGVAAVQHRGRPRVSVVKHISSSRGSAVDPNRSRIFEAENISPSRGAAVGPQYDPSQSLNIVSEYISSSCQAAAKLQPGPSRARDNVVENICLSRGETTGPQADPSRSRIIVAEHISPSCGAAVEAQPGLSRPRVSVVKHISSSRGAAVGPQSDPSQSRIIEAEHISPPREAAVDSQSDSSRSRIIVAEHFSPSRGAGGFEDSTDSEMGDDLSDFNDEVESDEPLNDEVACHKMPIDPECSCGLAEEVARLESENCKLRKQNKNLKKRQSKLELSHGKMQQALLSKLLPYTHKPFENVQSFPDCPSADKILRMSTEAKDSDYIFVKLIMNATWPEGYAGMSVTGRASNNPKGRGKKPFLLATDESCDVISQGPIRAALDPTKVKFVNDCLIERRLLLHDTDLVARRIGSKCNRLMQTVISNYNRYHSPE